MALTAAGVVSGRSCRSMAGGDDLEDVKGMVKPLFEMPTEEEMEMPSQAKEAAIPAGPEQADAGMEPVPAPRPTFLPPLDARKRTQRLEQQAMPLEGKLLRLFHEEVGKTPQCPACDLGSHRHQHTYVCRTRKVEWAQSSTSAKRLRAQAGGCAGAGYPR